MSTVNRRYPTYRDLLAILQTFNDEDLDRPIQICTSKDDEYTNAVFEYSHDFNNPAGPRIGFKTASRIEDDDLIRYYVIEDDCGEIIEQGLTYPDIINLCKTRNLTIKSFDKEPDVYGDFYCEVTGYYKDIPF